MWAHPQCRCGFDDGRDHGPCRWFLETMLTSPCVALRAGSTYAFILASRMRRGLNPIVFADMSSESLARESMLQ